MSWLVSCVAACVLRCLKSQSFEWCLVSRLVLNVLSHIVSWHVSRQMSLSRKKCLDSTTDSNSYITLALFMSPNTTWQRKKTACNWPLSVKTSKVWLTTITNWLMSLENRSAFAEVTGKSIMAPFWLTICQRSSFFGATLYRILNSLSSALYA